MAKNVKNNNKPQKPNNFKPKAQAKKTEEPEEKVLIYKKGMTVAEIAEGFNKPINMVVMKLMQLGIMATQNQSVEKDSVELLAIDFGYEVKDEVITMYLDLKKSKS